VCLYAIVQTGGENRPGFGFDNLRKHYDSAGPACIHWRYRPRHRQDEVQAVRVQPGSGRNAQTGSHSDVAYSNSTSEPWRGGATDRSVSKHDWLYLAVMADDGRQQAFTKHVEKNQWLNN